MQNQLIVKRFVEYTFRLYECYEVNNSMGDLTFSMFFSFFQLPDYHDVIEHPMDFATVRKKLAGGSYSILEQFEVGNSFVWLCHPAIYCPAIRAAPFDGSGLCQLALFSKNSCSVTCKCMRLSLVKNFTLLFLLTMFYLVRDFPSTLCCFSLFNFSLFTDKKIMWRTHD